MSSEIKAGMFVLAALASIVYMTTRLTQNRFSFQGTKRYYSEIRDATGLLSKSKVKMSGLDVGQLDDVELSGQKVKATLRIAAGIQIYADASITVKTLGFLGDKYLELHPGTDTKPLLPEDSVIQESFGAASIEQLASKAGEVLENVKEITDVLKTAMRGEGENGDTRLDHILDNLEHFTEGLAGIDKLGDFAGQLNEIGSNVRQITDKVNKGEGTLGKLLNESETIDHINSTLSGVNKLVNRADRTAVYLDARVGMLTATGGSKSLVSMLIQPTYDKYYLLGVTAGPKGDYSSVKTTTTVNPDQGGGSSTVREEKLNETTIGINAQFAKRFGDAVIRLGLFETTGGAALDYMLFDDHVKVSVEGYRFQRGRDAQLNVWTEMHLFKPFFLWVGGDDMLNNVSKNFFGGAGLRFSDQDIKALVTAAAVGR